MNSLDQHLAQETRIRVMESCGRACARANAVRSAVACRGDVDKLLSTLERWVGENSVHRSGKVFQVVYPRCLHRTVASGPARLPDTYCYCSCGWLKEIFETVVQEPVQVTLMESIKRGAKRCRFTVQL